LNFILVVVGVSCIALGTFLATLKKELEPDLGRKTENISVLLFAAGATMLGIWLQNVFG
jgi:hypothetical protein